MTRRERRIASILLAERPDSVVWDAGGRLPGWRRSRRKANEWFLCSLLDYQVPWERAYDDGLRLAEDVLGDPDDLWGTIAATPKDEWMELCRRESIHRFPQAHERLWRIGNDLVRDYTGDVREIWAGTDAEGVWERLTALRVGEQLSRMILLGLRDTGILQGPMDVKADLHVRRVIGRAIRGGMATADEATALTRRLHPEDPSLLDFALWGIGHDHCHASDPRCEDCLLVRECRYAGPERAE